MYAARRNLRMHACIQLFPLRYRHHDIEMVPRDDDQTHGPKQSPTVVFAPQRVQTHWHFIQVLYVGYNVHGTYSIATWALPL